MQKTPPHNPLRVTAQAALIWRAIVPAWGSSCFNKDGHVLIAERLDNPGAWQMPQGGIDEGEAPETAVFREMEEEIGTRNAEILGSLEDWICYDFPTAAHGQENSGGSGKYIGQRQKWIALKFLGQDSDIKLDTHSEPEFSRWKWVPLNDLMQYVVPFKKKKDSL